MTGTCGRMGWAPATPARPHFPLLCRRRRPVSGASQTQTDGPPTRIESMDVHTGTVVLHDDDDTRMPLSLAGSESQKSTSDFVRKAGDLVSNFLLRPRKRFSSVLIASSDDISPQHDDDDDDDDLLGTRHELSSMKPSVIAVPTPDRSNATQSQKSRRGSGSDRNDNSSFSNMESTNHGIGSPPRTKKRHKTGKDSSLPGSKAYQATCYAIVSAAEGRRCSSLPLPKSYYCERHAPPQPSSKTACCGTTHDQWFYGKESTSRCWAMTGSNRRCQEMSVVHFDMCRRHLKYPPKRCFVPPPECCLVEEIITPPLAGDVGEGSRRRRCTDVPTPSEESSTSEKEGEEGDTDLSWDDLSTDDSDDSEDTDDSDDDGFSISSSEEDEGEDRKTLRGDRRPNGKRASASSSRPEAERPAADTTRTAASDGRKQKEVRPAAQTLQAKAARVSFEEPTEFDHSKDRLFFAKGNRLQCHYEARDGRRCPYQRKRGTDIYCYGHDILTPQVLASMAKSGIKIDSSSDDDDDSSTSDDDNERSSSMRQPRTYTHREFLKMWKNFEKFYMSTDEIENSKQVRSANQSMCPEDTDGQAKAQYGRLLPAAMKVRTLLP